MKQPWFRIKISIKCRSETMNAKTKKKGSAISVLEIGQNIEWKISHKVWFKTIRLSSYQERRDRHTVSMDWYLETTGTLPENLAMRKSDYGSILVFDRKTKYCYAIQTAVFVFGPWLISGKAVDSPQKQHFSILDSWLVVKRGNLWPSPKLSFDPRIVLRILFATRIDDCYNNQKSH